MRWVTLLDELGGRQGRGRRRRAASLGLVEGCCGVAREAPWRLWKGVGKALGEMSEKMGPQVASWDRFWTVLGLFFTSIFLLILVSVLDVLDLFNMIFCEAFCFGNVIRLTFVTLTPCARK